MRVMLRLPAGRLSVALALSAALLALFALHALPARADSDNPTATVEVRLVVSVTTHAQPDPASPVVATLPVGTLVDKIGAQMGTDGVMWVQVRAPDATPLGWMHLSDFLSGTNEDAPMFAAPPFVPFFPLPF